VWQQSEHEQSQKLTYNTIPSPSSEGRTCCHKRFGQDTGDGQEGEGQQTPSSELKPNHLQAAKSVNV